MCVCVCVPERESETRTWWRCSAILLWCYAMKMVLCVPKMKTVFITFVLMALYAPGISRKRTSSKRTPRFYEHVFVFTYNLFQIIRVKVEVLMDVTIHIYLFVYFCSPASLGSRWTSWSSWGTSIDFCFLFRIYYLFGAVTSSSSSLYIFVFFFPHWESFWVSARKCCKYSGGDGVLCGFRCSRAHCWMDASTESIRATAQINCSNTETTSAHSQWATHTHTYTHKDISTSTHSFAFTHGEKSQKQTYPWME